MLSPGAALCLACLSSLPSRKFAEDTTFHTPCCSRPICAACLTRNPRLARYNPCLRCLGGVGVVRSHSKPQSPSTVGIPDDVPKNVDGGVHDDDVFAIGDDNEEDDSQDEDARDVVPLIASTPAVEGRSGPGPSSPPPSNAPSQTDISQVDETLSPDDSAISAHAGPPKYYIQPNDTLTGISLKFGVDGRLLCRLNNLPPSTLRTTPHLLHTRTYLIFPPSTQVPPTKSQSSAADEQRRVRREREIAERRFQTLTKEVDISIAKVYVSLAEHQDGGDEEGQYELNKEGDLKAAKEKFPILASGSSLEGRAIDRYLDDDEWEARERKGGRGVSIPKFPLSAEGSRTSEKWGKWSPSWWKSSN
ncbi:hypothetical protein QCA50_005929 [Cerrena zonata]|uniref:LysM domain-containing protein n=1 Tax=Cerrena zonata TaxID=2478898 RepID=A0AAW0GKR3_9APHY